MKKFDLQNYSNELEMYKDKAKYFEEKHSHKKSLLIVVSVCLFAMFINIARMS
jgi:hypothetical protein